MEATHIRFALDLMPLLKIDDIDAYCAGAVYPDTRYVTRVDRDVTHGLACPHDPFADNLNDFERGWATHLLYDRLAGGVMKSFISSELGPVTQGSPAWVTMMAMKVVEDLEAIGQRPEVLMRLHGLSISKAPSDESLELLKSFHSIVSTLYQDIPTLEDYREWIVGIGAPVELAESIVIQARQISEDDAYSAKIRAIYRETLEGVLIDRSGKSA